MFFLWCFVFWRNVDERNCTYHNSSDWIRSVVIGMGHCSIRLDCGGFCSLHLLHYYLVYFYSSYWLLQISHHWIKKLHLHQSCKSQFRYKWFMEKLRYHQSITFQSTLSCYSYFIGESLRPMHSGGSTGRTEFAWFGVVCLCWPATKQRVQAWCMAQWVLPQWVFKGSTYVLRVSVR